MVISDWSSDVCSSDLARDVAGCEAELGELIRLQPYAHGVVSRAEQAGIADAGDSLELVDDVEQSVVAHEQTVVTFVGRREGDQRQDRTGALLHGHTLLAHLLRQPRQRRSEEHTSEL